MAEVAAAQQQDDGNSLEAVAPIVVEYDPITGTVCNKIISRFDSVLSYGRINQVNCFGLNSLSNLNGRPCTVAETKDPCFQE